MAPLVTLFDPQPDRAQRPARLPSPFDPAGPHPWARRAAEQLMAQLPRQTVAAATEAARGKMFGVLVVEDQQGQVGYLRAFSGMLDGHWPLDGFAGPLFDLAHRQSFWPAGEAALIALDRQIEELTTGPPMAALQARLAAQDRCHADALQALQTQHDQQQRRRQQQRAQLAAAPAQQQQQALQALSHQSQQEATARRRLRAAQREQRAAILAQIAAIDAQRVQLQQQRHAQSNALLEPLYAGYRISSARGQVRLLRDLFAPKTPPGGAGDCAAPKLFNEARRLGLRPLALAEFWWGAPPATGGRQQGRYYPACRGKCGPVLAHMLDGWDVDLPPLFGADPLAAHEPRIVYEDAALLVVDKPAGMLSVPGRSTHLTDSALTRLRARVGPSTLLVHRLDLDTSGLLLAAKDTATYVALQRQFSERQVEKRYIALVEGSVRGEQGTVDLPLRVDLDDRPRQVHDPVSGKPASTSWRVLQRSAGRTRLELIPHTGRTHQLRVHAAHPQGLAAPIVGDRLYGTPDQRLCLHAERLGFTHPHTGRRVTLHSPAPF